MTLSDETEDPAPEEAAPAAEGSGIEAGGDRPAGSEVGAEQSPAAVAQTIEPAAVEAAQAAARSAGEAVSVAATVASVEPAALEAAQAAARTAAEAAAAAHAAVERIAALAASPEQRAEASKAVADAAHAAATAAEAAARAAAAARAVYGSVEAGGATSADQPGEARQVGPMTHVIPLLTPESLTPPPSRPVRIARRIAGAIAAVIIGTATALVILGFSVTLFLNPVWVSSEQDRVKAGVATQFGPDDLHRVTGSILYDLVIGPPDFAVQVNGQPVLTESERGHLRDVRNVFIAFTILVMIAATVLIAARLATRGSRPFWGRVYRAARFLAAATVIAGAIAIFWFGPAFDLFHRLLFPGGNWEFDQSSRLIKLFPQQFWVDTTVFLGAAMVLVAVGVAHWSGERASGPKPDPFAARRAMASSRPAS